MQKLKYTSLQKSHDYHAQIKNYEEQINGEMKKKFKMLLDLGSYVECGWYQRIDKNCDDVPTGKKYLF